MFHSQRFTEYYPGIVSPNGFFGEFPYIIPNLISAAISLVGLVLGWIFLKETLNADRATQNPLETPESESVEESASGKYKRLNTEEEPNDSRKADGTTLEAPIMANGGEEVGFLKDEEKDLESGDSHEDEEDNGESKGGGLFMNNDSRAQQLNEKRQAGFKLMRLSHANLYIGELRPGCKKEKAKETKRLQREWTRLSRWGQALRPSEDSVLRNRLSLLTCSLYALLGAMYVVFDEETAFAQYTTLIQ